MKKMLYIGNVGKAQSYSFYRSAAVAARELGIEFHIAFNCVDRTKSNVKRMESDLGIYFHQIDFERNPLHFANIRAYKQLIALMKAYDFDFIHCNTPVGGLCGRLTARRCGIKKVIYQAHGFHFYKGAPLINWLLYYPVEKLLARCTDVLIAINKEDFALAQVKMRLRNNGAVYYVPGVGIDLSDPPETDRAEVRKSLGLPEDAFVLVSVGELNKNKNNAVIVEAVKKLDDSVHYALCGTGPEEQKLKALAETLGLSGRVHFLGYRDDVKTILRASDIFVSMSYREGLSRSVMEAMSMGLPCVVSDIRGNRDLLSHQSAQCVPIDADALSRAVSELRGDQDLLMAYGEANRKAVRKFGMESVVERLKQIYRSLL